MCRGTELENFGIPLPYTPPHATLPNAQKPRTSRIPKERIGHVRVKLQELRAHGLEDVERIAADWICTMLLTGTRLSESGSLKRSELNLSARRIRLRGDVVKNHHDLTLPISATLHEILEARLTASDIDTPAARRRKRERSTEYVFPSFGKRQPFLTDARSTLEAVSEAAGIHVSPHVLRRTCEDILKFAGVDPDERRLLLNHLARDVHGAHYANDDDPESLRPAVEAASNWVLEQARIAEAAANGENVIAFPTSPQSGARMR
jgi:integrase